MEDLTGGYHGPQDGPMTTTTVQTPDGHTVTLQRIAKGKRSDTAYAVTYQDTFLGYVVGRDGGWSAQPEQDPAVPVEPTFRFVYAQPSRGYVADDLVAEAIQAGLVKA